MSETKNIAILYIATGRYTIFWDVFYESAERYFLPTCQKHYFVFTDRSEDIRHKGNVQIIEQEKLGWPYDTLMRFDIFLKAEEMLKPMDYIYFFNANLEFIDTITESEFISPDKPLLGILHPGFWDKTPEQFTYDRNIDSLVYIPQDTGYQYFMGGGNGGRADAYLSLIHELSRRISYDLDKGLIALWHDESHLNRYYYEQHDNLHILSVSYSTPEEWYSGNMLRKLLYARGLRQRGVKVVIRNKANPWFGGHAWLRGETDKKRLGFKQSVQVVLYRLIHLLGLDK